LQVVLREARIGLEKSKNFTADFKRTPPKGVGNLKTESKRPGRYVIRTGRAG